MCRLNWLRDGWCPIWLGKLVFCTSRSTWSAVESMAICTVEIGYSYFVQTPGAILDNIGMHNHPSRVFVFHSTAQRPELLVNRNHSPTLVRWRAVVRSGSYDNTDLSHPQLNFLSLFIVFRNPGLPPVTNFQCSYSNCYMRINHPKVSEMISRPKSLPVSSKFTREVKLYVL